MCRGLTQFVCPGGCGRVANGPAAFRFGVCDDLSCDNIQNYCYITLPRNRIAEFNFRCSTENCEYNPHTTDEATDLLDKLAKDPERVSETFEEEMMQLLIDNGQMEEVSLGQPAAARHEEPMANGDELSTNHHNLSQPALSADQSPAAGLPSTPTQDIAAIVTAAERQRRQIRRQTRTRHYKTRLATRPRRRPASGYIKGESTDDREARFRVDAQQFLSTYHNSPRPLNPIFATPGPDVPDPGKTRGPRAPGARAHPRSGNMGKQAVVDLFYMRRIMDPPMRYEQIRRDPRFAAYTNRTLGDAVSNLVTRSTS